MPDGKKAEVRIPGVTAPAPGHAIRVSVNGTPVAIFNLGTTLVGLDAECPHEGGPLDEGPVDGGNVTCPWHGSVFRLSDGALIEGPAESPVKPYRVTLDGTTLVVHPG